MGLSFSIIIPVHNSEKTIEKCIKSLSNQHDISLQIIVIENGSTDNSLAVCRELTTKYKNIEVYSIEISGVSNARNIGLLHANGDIIGFCDADDYFETDCLKKIEHIFLKLNADMIITAFSVVYNNGIKKIKCQKQELINGDRFIEYLMCYPPVMGSVWNKFYRRKLIRNECRFPENLGYMEDTFFNVKVVEKNRDLQIAIVKDNTYYYIRNDDSVTSHRSTSKLFDYNGEFLSNKTRKLMLNELKLTKQEKSYIRDSLCQESIIAIHRYGRGISQESYIKLYEEIKKNILIFIMRIFKFDFVNKAKYALYGMWILLKGRN